ncbi:MAG: alpha-hydroxy-acid oxidizing protein [Acidimicrobiales bacterium]|nr:alpha-hydroxy-acid oxidizing protein [Acidimicrobiales bacterium]|tara:strand:- start:4857 stop:6080 length:1224 start_codon:yes stop_codon:yes gene_type:complete
MAFVNSIRSVVKFRKLEINRTKRLLRKAANVEDLRKLAKRRLPIGVFDYIDGGAEDEITLRKNVEAYRKVSFKPRVLRDMANIDTSTSLFGRKLAFPLVLAPTGFTRIAHSEGELAVVRAATRAGIPFTLSTMATRSIEECASVAEKDSRLWFQIYTWKDRSVVKNLVERADAAGFEAVCLTVDTAVLGRRERDVRRGFTLPPEIGLGTIIDGVKNPGWTWDFLTADPIRFANVEGLTSIDGSTAVDLAEHMKSQFDPGLSWKDVEWLRSIWKGPILIKGIQTVEDALIAVDSGVEAIAISNHGGRQLDEAPTPFDLLPEVAEAVQDRLEIICDGGARRGSDIVKAVSLGATAVMAGRPYLYALAACGESGVDHVLDLLHEGVERTMSLTGAASVDDLTKELISRTE